MYLQTSSSYCRCKQMQLFVDLRAGFFAQYLAISCFILLEEVPTWSGPRPPQPLDSDEAYLYFSVCACACVCVQAVEVMWFLLHVAAFSVDD